LGDRIQARTILDVPFREEDYGEGHQLADEDLFVVAEVIEYSSTELPVSTKRKIFQLVYYSAV
jgi:hypothetical protein